MKLTETVNFCETIEESEGEEGRDSSCDGLPSDDLDEFKRRARISLLDNNFSALGRNKTGFQRYNTFH